MVHPIMREEMAGAFPNLRDGTTLSCMRVWRLALRSAWQSASLVNQLRDHLYRCAVDKMEKRLWVNAHYEHQRNYRSNRQQFAPVQITETVPFCRHRSVEHALDNRQQENRADKQADHRSCRRPFHQRKHALENEEFSNESIQPRQTE